MRTQREIEKRLAKVLADERLSYPSATIRENAPLALIQVELETERNLLYWMLQHRHVSGETVGGHADRCAICKHDIRNPIHVRGIPGGEGKA